MTTRDEEKKEEEPSESRFRGALLKGQESGRFLDALAEAWLRSSVDEEALAREVAAMHNEGLVDVVGAFSSLPNNGHMFFPMRHVFETALPRMEADVVSAMRCVYTSCGYSDDGDRSFRRT
jgi:hypothetical protein